MKPSAPCTPKAIKLFKAMKTSSKVLDRIGKGEAVSVLVYGKNGVPLPHGAAGYVQTKVLTDVPAPTQPRAHPPPSGHPIVPDSRALPFTRG